MSNANPTTMQDPNNAIFNLAAADGAIDATALPIDGPRPEAAFDPEIGEESTMQFKAELLAMEPAQVQASNVDCLLAAVAAATFAAQCEGPTVGPKLASMPALFMGDATPARLRKFSEVVFYTENRTRTRSATASGVRVDGKIVAEGQALRDRMLKVLAYHFDDDAYMRAEIADIRLGSGYVDLASDLARVATHYTRHRATLEKDVKFYKHEDMVRARGISSEILAALQAESDGSIVDLRNRAFTKMARIYARLKAACDFIFADSPTELATFLPLRQAVMALSSKSRRSGADDVPADPPVAPGAPITAPVASPIAAPVAQPLGTGPGGNPLI